VRNRPGDGCDGQAQDKQERELFADAHAYS
jgi:hypothetical protein